MDELTKKAKNYFIIAMIAEKMKMYSESISNYFKSLSAINDFALERINLKAKDHSKRFRLLEKNFPELYAIADKMFTVYRRTYTNELNKEEVEILRKNVEKAFENAGVQIPGIEEIKSKTKKISEK